MFGRCNRGRYSLRNRERQPRIPAVGPVVGIKLGISLQAEKCLFLSNLENISELRTDAENARAETAENSRLTEIFGDLLVGIADEPDKDLLRQELRHAPVEM